MNIIELYENLKGSYKSYLESFVTIKDERIKEKVSDSIKHEELWPKALIQFNPNAVFSAAAISACACRASVITRPILTNSWVTPL